MTAEMKERSFDRSWAATLLLRQDIGWVILENGEVFEDRDNDKENGQGCA